MGCNVFNADYDLRLLDTFHFTSNLKMSMILFRLSTLLSLAYSLPTLLASNGGNKMNCGASVPYCGVLVLERGTGCISKVLRFNSFQFINMYIML